LTEAELKKHLDAAEKSPKEIAAAVSGLSNKALHYKPSPEKWCVLEILGHLADVEIIYGYRLRQMLADTKPVIAPIDQDAWARNLNYLDSPPSELVAFYGLGRHHNLRLLRNLKVSVCLSPGNATGGDRCRPGGKDGGTRCCALASDREIESSSEQRVGSAAPYSAPAAGMVVEITLIDSEPWWQ